MFSKSALLPAIAMAMFGGPWRWSSSTHARNVLKLSCKKGEINVLVDDCGIFNTLHIEAFNTFFFR